jgi:hypothetical protein
LQHNKQTQRIIKNIPIGIQAFSSLIEGNFVYLDKTDMIYKIANKKACYFLSRPRRFGKSLTISTLKAYFDGRKELFAGTKMETLETKWDKYPILYLDFNSAKYDSLQNFRDSLSFLLENYEIKYGLQSNYELPTRFARLVTAAYQQTGKKVVILVDEYDKPLLNNIINTELQDLIRKELKAFYGVLKTYDEQIKMAFITGVTKFSKVSLFSDVNNLKDISNTLEFATLCGVTEQEIHEQLDEHVGIMADFNNMTKKECYKELKKWYEGYHFHQNSVDIYNPDSLARALDNKEVGYNWYENGAPSFLVNIVRHYNIKPINIDNIKCKVSDLSTIETFNNDIIPILYITGFLTIKSYDKESETYTLGLPSKEVGNAFKYLRL